MGNDSSLVFLIYGTFIHLKDSYTTFLIVKAIYCIVYWGVLPALHCIAWPVSLSLKWYNPEAHAQPHLFFVECGLLERVRSEKPFAWPLPIQTNRTFIKLQGERIALLGELLGENMAGEVNITFKELGFLSVKYFLFALLICCAGNTNFHVNLTGYKKMVTFSDCFLCLTLPMRARKWWHFPIIFYLLESSFLNCSHLSCLLTSHCGIEFESSLSKGFYRVINNLQPPQVLGCLVSLDFLSVCMAKLSHIFTEWKSSFELLCHSSVCIHSCTGILYTQQVRFCFRSDRLGPAQRKPPSKKRPSHKTHHQTGSGPSRFPWEPMSSMEEPLRQHEDSLQRTRDSRDVGILSWTLKKPVAFFLSWACKSSSDLSGYFRNKESRGAIWTIDPSSAILHVFGGSGSPADFPSPNYWC